MWDVPLNLPTAKSRLSTSPGDRQQSCAFPDHDTLIEIFFDDFFLPVVTDTVTEQVPFLRPRMLVPETRQIDLDLDATERVTRDVFDVVSPAAFSSAARLNDFETFTAGTAGELAEGDDEPALEGTVVGAVVVVEADGSGSFTFGFASAVKTARSVGVEWL